MRNAGFEKKISWFSKKCFGSWDMTEQGHPNMSLCVVRVGVCVCVLSSVQIAGCESCFLGVQAGSTVGSQLALSWLSVGSTVGSQLALQFSRVFAICIKIIKYMLLLKAVLLSPTLCSYVKTESQLRANCRAN